MKPPVEIEITEAEIEADDGRLIDGLCLICEKCRHEIEVFGDGEKSIKYGFYRMSYECPMKENNFYVSNSD